MNIWLIFYTYGGSHYSLSSIYTMEIPFVIAIQGVPRKYLVSYMSFFGGGGSIVTQTSFIMLIFLLFSDQISGGQKSLRGENCLRWRPLSPSPPPRGRNPVLPFEKESKSSLLLQCFTIFRF